MDTIRIGLISDTHNLLRPEARTALKDVDYIIHAGDICKPEILQELGMLAPVIAVRGNNDPEERLQGVRERERVTIGGVVIYVVHDLHDLDLVPEEAGVHVVISGHSHRPTTHRERGVLYVNPGSAGPRRFKLPISVGFLEIREGVAKARLQVLEVD